MASRGTARQPSHSQFELQPAVGARGHGSWRRPVNEYDAQAYQGEDGGEHISDACRPARGEPAHADVTVCVCKKRACPRLSLHPKPTHLTASLAAYWARVS